MGLSKHYDTFYKHPLESNTPVVETAEEISTIKSEGIDCIDSAETIEHITDVYIATDEMLTVLQPSRSLVINTPNKAFIKKRFLLLLDRIPSTSQTNERLGSDTLSDGRHLLYSSFHSLTLLLQRAGFQIKNAIGYWMLGRIQSFHTPLLSSGVQLLAKKPIK